MGEYPSILNTLSQRAFCFVGRYTFCFAHLFAKGSTPMVWSLLFLVHLKFTASAPCRTPAGGPVGRTAVAASRTAAGAAVLLDVPGGHKAVDQHVVSLP